MHGTEVTFFDPRLSDPEQYPVAARSGSWNTRGSDPGKASDKLDALQYYQLSIPAPKPPARSVNVAAAARGKALFLDKAQCATCHVPPLYTEPGYAIHKPAEIGIDRFQAGSWPHRRGEARPRTVPPFDLIATPGRRPRCVARRGNELVARRCRFSVADSAAGRCDRHAYVLSAMAGDPLAAHHLHRMAGGSVALQ
jgi:hypothetical protein